MTDTPNLALPCIEELVRETGETVHLGVFDGSQVVSIEKMDSPHGLASNVTIGKGAPAYCTGVGKALLAHQPDAVVEHVCRLGLAKHTRQTITEPERLRRETVVRPSRNRGRLMSPAMAVERVEIGLPRRGQRRGGGPFVAQVGDRDG